MKVILKQEVKGLGAKEAVVEVAEGYARNYLIPRGLAVEASVGRLREVEQRREVAKKRKDRAKEEALRLAASLEGKEVRITMRAGEGGKLFGSVTTREIAETLARDYRIKVDRKQIELKEPIKALGNYTLTARLHPGVLVIFNLQVNSE